MRKILVIDDDVSLRKGLACRLQSAGFAVETTGYPDVALGAALASPPDAILLDIEMPGMNGFQFFDCMRATERGRSIPVIILSGKTSDRHIASAESKGIRAFLPKPYDPQTVVRTIQSVLSN